MNWASIVALLLFLYWLVAVPGAAVQVFFVLTRRADTTPNVVGKAVLQVIVGFGRLLGLPLIAFILFFQGWRLDPILQFACVLMAAGIIAESSASALADYQTWRHRLGRATAVIQVEQRPGEDSL